MGDIEKSLSEGFYYDKKSDVSVSVSTREHSHDNYEIYFLEKGFCEYIISGRKYQLKSGDLIFVMQNAEHSTDYKNKLYTRRLINFSKDYIPASLLSDSFSESAIFRCESIVKELLRIFDLIEAEYQKKEIYSDNVLKCLVNILCYTVSRSEKEELSFISADAVRRATSYIEENYMNEVTLSKAAEICAISGEHLSRLFKKEMNIGFNEYLNLVRLKKAEQMLINEKGKSIFEIAFSCGFSDSNYFSYKFRKHYGVSPKEIRRK